MTKTTGTAGLGITKGSPR